MIGSLAATTLMLAGCGGAVDPVAGVSDTGPGDTGPSKTAPSDTAPGDTGPSDTAPGDTAPDTVAPGPTTTGVAAPSTAAVGEPGGPAASTEPPADQEGLSVEPPAEGETGRVEQEGSGRIFLVDARLGSHDGFDRVVWEYAGDGTPGWFAGYTDDPRQQGSGDPVDVAGQAVLELYVNSVAWQAEEGDPVPVPYEGVQTLTSEAAQVVTVVDVEMIFEADQQSFVGLTAERPYRVSMLRDPTRVVLDIAH